MRFWSEKEGQRDAGSGVGSLAGPPADGEASWAAVGPYPVLSREVSQPHPASRCLP